MESKAKEKSKSRDLKSSQITRFEKRLNKIVSDLLKMGNLCKQSLKKTFKILQEKDLGSVEDILEIEEKINQFHIKVDDRCWKVLAQQSPVAIDLRQVLSSIKINSELERIGDQSVNIALNVKKHFHLEKTLPPKSLFQIIKRIEEMLRLSLNSVKENDSELAQDIIKMDRKVNEYHTNLIRDLIQTIREGSEDVDDIMTLILVARSLERIGDHMTNIAENVIFIQSGKDVRHNNLKAFEINKKATAVEPA